MSGKGGAPLRPSRFASADAPRPNSSMVTRLPPPSHPLMFWGRKWSFSLACFPLACTERSIRAQTANE